MGAVVETAMRGSSPGHRAAMVAELDEVKQKQAPGALQLMPATLRRHLEGVTEKLRSGVNGKVREGIQQLVTRIVVGLDGSLAIDGNAENVLGVKVRARSLVLDGDEAIMDIVKTDGGRIWRVRYSIG
ncbi:MAG TPA: hypothetical protein VMG58_01085 [Candidatus Sulfotelmatobacter sp.]|nr:hypothetical protein [Candidatus Sulfotelmatobacter sp.]